MEERKGIMKKLLLVGLIFALLLCFAACGGEKKPGSNTGSGSEVTTTETPGSSSSGDNTNPDNTQTTEGETFSPDLNLTEIDYFN